MSIERILESHQNNQLTAEFTAWGMEGSKPSDFLDTIVKLKGAQKDLSVDNKDHIDISKNAAKFCTAASVGTGGSVRMSMSGARSQYVTSPIFTKLASDARDLSQLEYKSNFNLNFSSDGLLNFVDDNMKSKDIASIQRGNAKVFAFMKAVDSLCRKATDEINELKYIHVKIDKATKEEKKKLVNLDIEYVSPFFEKNDKTEGFSIALKMEKERTDKNTWDTTGYPPQKPELKDMNSSYIIKKGSRKEKCLRPLGAVAAFSDEDEIPADVTDKRKYRLHMSRLHLMFGAGTIIDGTFRADFTFSKGKLRVGFVFCDKTLKVKPCKPGQRSDMERESIYGAISNSIDSETSEEEDDEKNDDIESALTDGL